MAIRPIPGAPGQQGGGGPSGGGRRPPRPEGQAGDWDRDIEGADRGEPRDVGERLGRSGQSGTPLRSQPQSALGGQAGNPSGSETRMASGRSGNEGSSGKDRR